MAVTATPSDSRLQMKFQTGFDENGNPVVKTKTLNGVKSAADNQDLYDIAQGLGGLQVYDLVTIRRIDEVELTESI